MWFIGLVFKKISTGGVNITITYEIQVFSNAGLSTTHTHTHCNLWHITCIHECTHAHLHVDSSPCHLSHLGSSVAEYLSGVRSVMGLSPTYILLCNSAHFKELSRVLLCCVVLCCVALFVVSYVVHVYTCIHVQ